MGIRHLRIFVSVYQLCSVTLAAKELHLAQPSVSLAIRELEEYYGIRLFDRISRKLHRTQSGTAFYNYASHIVALYDEMEHSAKAGDTCTSLHIGASITIGNFYLPDLVSGFSALYPKVDVRAIIHNCEYLIQQLLSNQLDLALIEGHTVSPQLQAFPFSQDSMVFIAGKNHPILSRSHIKTKDLAAYRFLLREKGSAGRTLFDSLTAQHDVEISPQWESASTQALVKAVSAGLGLSFLPELLVRNDISQGIVHHVEVEDAQLKRQFFIVTHKNKYLSPAAQNFIALCKTQTAGERAL